MAEYTKYVEEAQAQALSTFDQFAKSQEAVLNAFKEAAAAVQEEIPTPFELVENSFAFTTRVLDFEKRYTLKLLEALTPVKA